MKLDYRWIKAKFSSKCFECEAQIEVGDLILFVVDERKAYCEDCGEQIDAD